MSATQPPPTKANDHHPHSHVFGQDRVRQGERRTLLVVLLTAITMVVEIAAGLVYNSMALLADGLHMASHTVALGLTVVAYVVSRRLATTNRYTFGVGKIDSLAAFTSALLLLGFACAMVVESGDRLLNPVSISFEPAIIVATVGLIINAASARILIAVPHHSEHLNQDEQQTHDHNLQGAYLHVVTDALTSVLAIVALLAGKYMNAYWLDPAMGLVGAALITRWSVKLLRDTARVLLDQQLADADVQKLRRALCQQHSDKLTDLHVWSIGHNIYAAEIVIVSTAPRSPEHYKSLIPDELNIVHATIEIHRERSTP